MIFDIISNFIKDKDKSFFKYIISGLIAAIIEFLCFNLIYYVLFKNHLFVAQAISYFTGLITAFSLHYFYSFKSRKEQKNRNKQFILYFFVALFNLCFSFIFIKLLSKIGLSPMIAKLLVMGTIIIWNYTILNRHIFSKSITNLSLKNIFKKLQKNFITILLFLIIVSIGLVQIFINKVGVSFDEHAHIAKIESTSRLDFIPYQKNKDSYASSKGATEMQSFVTKNIEASFAKDINTYKRLDNEVKEIANKKYRSLPVEEVFPQGAGAYHSINYIPNAIGLYIARLLNMTVKQAYYSAKISALIINASIISFSFFLLQKYRSKFLVLIVALYPQILISLSSISVDGIINATSLLFGTIILKSLLDKKIPLLFIIIAILCGISMSISKLPYLLISMLIFFIPFKYFKKDSYNKIAKILFLIPIVILPLYWNYIMKDTTQYTSHNAYCCLSGVKADSKEQIKNILKNPINFTGSISEFIINFDLIEEGRIINPIEGSRNLRLNTSLLFVHLILSILIVAYVEREYNDKQYFKKIAPYWIFSILFTILGIIVALYVAANSVGQFHIWGVQTRYFYPLLFFIFVVISIYTPIKLKNFSSEKILRYTIITLIILNIFSTIQLYILPRTSNTYISYYSSSTQK